MLLYDFKSPTRYCWNFVKTNKSHFFVDIDATGIYNIKDCSQEIGFPWRTMYVSIAQLDRATAF